MSSCRFNAPLSEEELYQVADGDPNQKTLDHLEHCPHCAAQLKEIEEAEIFLSQILHPRAFELLSYQEKLLSPQEWQRINGHVQSCTVCQEQLKALDDLRADENEFTDDTQTRRMTSKLNQRHPHMPRKPSIPIMASLLQPANASQRLRTMGTSKGGAPKRLQYKADTLNISLAIITDSKGTHLEGLISGINDGWEDAIVTLKVLENEPIVTLVKAWKFSFSSVPAGMSEITIHSISLGRQVVITPLVF